MTAALQKLADGTIELTITVPWSAVTKIYTEVMDDAVKQAQLPGFRKGKAPRKLVEEKTDKNKTYEEVLQRLIPQVYQEAISQHQLHPIVSPKIELKEASEGKDWILRACTCERPAVNLGDYKSKIQELKANKQKKIWVPGQEKPKAGTEEKENKATLEELLAALAEAVEVHLPTILIEREVNRLLSELIDQTRKLGMSVEQYLASTGRTAESLRAEYSQQAQRSLKLEFSLEEIADKERVIIGDDEIDNVLKTVKTDEERQALSNQRYYLASLLRRQKTLDLLASL